MFFKKMFTPTVDLAEVYKKEFEAIYTVAFNNTEEILNPTFEKFRISKRNTLEAFFDVFIDESVRKSFLSKD
jgi:hypothetical protein